MLSTAVSWVVVLLTRESFPFGRDQLVLSSLLHSSSSDLMEDYQKLSTHERRKNDKAVSAAFQQLIQRIQPAPTDLDPAFRRSSIKLILSDLTANIDGTTHWSTDTTLHALIALKLLGRSSVATDDLTNHLPLLTRFANLLAPPTPLPILIIQEALRIIANTLFLHPLSRSSPHLLPALSSLVQIAINNDHSKLLQQEQQLSSFLASRVIFLITAVPSTLVCDIIDRTDLTEYLERSFKYQLDLKLNSNQLHPSISQDVLIEHLKIIFNLMVHYPKSIQQYAGQSNSPILGSISSTTTADLPSPDQASPSSRRASLKSRFMNQINMKKISRLARSETSSGKDPDQINDTYPDDLIASPSKSHHSRYHSKASGSSSRVPSVDQTLEGLGVVTDPRNHVFAGLLPHLIQLFLLEPIPNPPNLKPPLISFLHALLNFSPSALNFFTDEYKLLEESYRNTEIPPVISKLMTIIDRVTNYYCPGDPDDRLVKEKCHLDSVDLEVDLTQVLLLTANLISPHTPSHMSLGLSNQSREALIEKVMPSNIDRSVALDKQDNLIGRILRLMNSVRFENLKHTCGAFLSALYADDTDRLTSQVGYGPLAGYLLSIGKAGMTAESNYDTRGGEINPITGKYWPSEESSECAEKVLSESEKEQEAERLCALFDRMNRGGVISAPDPRKLAVESGRFEEIETKLASQLDQQEKLEEIKALRELELYKEKKRK